MMESVMSRDKLKNNLAFHTDRAKALRQVRDALGDSQAKFTSRINEKLRSLGQNEITRNMYSNYEGLYSGVTENVWEAFQKIRDENSQILHGVQNVSSITDPRHTNKFFPIPIFPNTISEVKLIEKLDYYQGAYLCYYDLMSVPQRAMSQLS